MLLSICLEQSDNAVALWLQLLILKVKSGGRKVAQSCSPDPNTAAMNIVMSDDIW